MINKYKIKLYEQIQCINCEGTGEISLPGPNNTTIMDHCMNCMGTGVDESTTIMTIKDLLELLNNK